MKPNQFNEALLQAVQTEPLSAVKQLIEELGVEVNIRDTLGTGNTPLMLAAKNKQTQIVEYLIKAGATINVTNFFDMTALMFAAESGQLEIVKALLAAKADVNQMSPTGCPDALSLAAGNKHISVVKALIHAGANVNAATTSGHTALMSAVFSEDVNMVSTLLEAGADPEMKDWEGQTALDMAISNDFTDIVKKLKTSGKKNQDVPPKPALDSAIDINNILRFVKNKIAPTAMDKTTFLSKAKNLYIEFKKHPSYYILSVTTRLAVGALAGYGMFYGLTAMAAPIASLNFLTGFLPKTISAVSMLGGAFASVKLADSLLTRFFGETKIMARIFPKQNAPGQYEVKIAEVTKKGILDHFGQSRPYVNKSVSELVNQLEKEFKLKNKDKPTLLPQSKIFALAFAKQAVESQAGDTYFDSTAKEAVKTEPFVSAAKHKF